MSNGWEWKRLGNLIDHVSDKVFPSVASDLEFVGMDSIAPHALTLGRTTPFRHLKSAASRFHEGDILYGRLRPYLNKVWLADRTGACSGELLTFRPRDGYSGAYIRFILHDRRFVDFASHAVTGDRPRIDFGTIAQYPVPIPTSLDDQLNIVQSVNALFSDIDDGETARARARAGLEVYRRALLKAAVTGELTADWRAANPPRETGPQLLARILADRRARWEADPKNKEKKYSAPILPIVSNLPDLPNQWAWASLDQLCGHITSGSRAWSPYYDLGEAVFVMAQNVRRGYYDKTFEQLVGPPANDPERMRTRVSKSDLLLTIVGANTGDICSVNFDPEERYVCQSVALLRPLMPELAPFVEAFFANEFGRKLQMEKLIYGAGRPHLSFDQIRSLAVPLCPMVEIDQVSRHISQAHSVSNPTFETLDSLSNSATELRQSILSAAFRGELSPS